MNSNFDAREAYGFKEEDAFALFNPINQDEIMAYLNGIAEKRGLYALGPDDAEKARELRTNIWYTCLINGPKWVLGPGYWYAVLEDENDHDWSKGSYNLEEAKRMLRQFPNGYIAFIDEEGDDLEPEGPICVGELRLN